MKDQTFGAKKLQITETHMEGPCDICGGYTDQGIAFAHSIVTCCKCRINREHLYCMWGKVFSNRERWVCESCAKEERKGDPAPSSGYINDVASPSKGLKYSGWQAHSNRQKAVETGKVRFITHEEVQKLSRPSLQKTFSVFPKRGRPSKRQSIPFSTAQTVAPPGRNRPPKMLSISRIDEQSSQIIKVPQEKWSPGTHTKRHVIPEKPMDASVRSRGAETSSRKILQEPNKLSCTQSPSPSRHSSLNMSSGSETSAAEHNHSDGEGRDLLNTFSSLHIYRLYLPSLHATWKGGFNVFDADTPVQSFDGFQAQPPCRVRRRVHDFSQNMPAFLQATLLPRSHLCDDPFHSDCPGLEDVALYFFPDDSIASSRQSYASLFEIMDTRNSVLTIHFDGVNAVELLIYTSKQLRLDLLDTVTCPKTQNFLWGIFRCKSDCQADMDDSGTNVDMEVDMVGGQMVGSVDVAVPKDSSTPCGTSEQPIMTELTAVQQLLRITKEEHSTQESKLKALDTAIKQFLGVKSEELKDSDTSTSSAKLENRRALQQVKLEKDDHDGDNQSWDPFAQFS